MTQPYRIITVCTGNICRSPMAELMLAVAFDEAGLAVEVDSAGTTGWEEGNPIDPRAAATLARHGIGSDRHGISASGHAARKFRPAWYAERELILALDTDHLEPLHRGAPDAASRDRVRMLRSFDPAAAGRPDTELGIPDPWYGGWAEFEQTWELIHAAVPGIVAFVRAELDAGAGSEDTLRAGR
ncbi:MAG: low molecular weight protein-tyrosine-phosphatase [Actinomycetales bacterium]